MKKFIYCLLVIILTVTVTACGEEYESWPERGISTVLPVPDSDKITNIFDYEDSFSADIEKSSIKFFNDYVSKCEAVGFNIDVESSSEEYSAFNEEGYKVTVYYKEYDKSISIDLEGPKVKGEISWPEIGLAALIPEPDSGVGSIESDSSDMFNVYIGETSLEDYKTYITQCIEVGFDVDYDSGEKYFHAKNKDGIDVDIDYEGFNTMHIIVRTPYETEEETTATSLPEATDKPIVTSTPSATSSSENKEDTETSGNNLVDGMRPEFKEAMDSYEDFFDEYCNFMKKYSESSDDLSLLADYTNYMSKYADTMAKLDALENEDLNDAEMKYYIEVMNRINEKLLDVSGTV